MKDFMVEFTITGDPKSEEFQSIIPAEKKRVEELIQSGEIKHIWFKEDYSGGYFVAYTKNETSLYTLFDSLPLKPYLAFISYPLKAN